VGIALATSNPVYPRHKYDTPNFDWTQRRVSQLKAAPARGSNAFPNRGKDEYDVKNAAKKVTRKSVVKTTVKEAATTTQRRSHNGPHHGPR
jgi:hypothetical protein